MKKLLLGITLIASISTLASDHLVSGMVKQVECDSRAGKGIVEVATVDGKTIYNTWYKVNSNDLCAPTQNNLMFLGKTSQLGALSAENIGLNTSGNGNYTTFFVQNDTIIGIESNESVAFDEYFDGAISSVRENVAEAHKWYFGEVKGMNTSNWADK